MSTPPPAVPRTAPPGPATRLTSLDGLRGLAALVVLFHHLSLTSPPISDFFLKGVYPPKGSLTWLLTLSPAQLVVAGPEAVLVFFVLSGVVLTLPVLRRPGTFDWVAYYPQRVVRLYLPAMASVVLAAILVIATTSTTAPSSSGWVAIYRLRGFDPHRVVSAWDLLFGDGTLNNPLWTLRWEVTFSLILPIVIILAVLSRRWWPLAVLASVAVVFAGIEWGVDALRYLPPFLIGAIIAVNHQRLSDWAAKPEHRRRVGWGGVAVLILSLVLLNLHWTALGLSGGVPHGQEYLITLETLGASGLVLLAAYWSPARWVLRTPVFHWLGRVSFSLYLVHVPIIDAVDAVFGSSTPVVRVALSLVLALGVAELFSRFVEQPAHRLARRVGRAASGLISRLPAASPQSGG